MEETTEQVNWIQDTIKKGVLLGSVHFVLFLAIYYTAPDLLAGFTYLFLILAINLSYCIYLGIEWRKGLGGYMGFGVAFKYSFMILLFNGLLGAVLLFVFILIDPELPGVMADAQLETSIYWAQKFGAPEASIDQIRERFNPEDVTKRFTAVGQLTGIGIVSIFYALGATIVAFATKKDVPLDM